MAITGRAAPMTKASRKLAIAQAYSIIRWDEKLKNLPADMVDGCYDFAFIVMNPQRDGIARDWRMK